MDRALLDILVCPYSGGPLRLEAFEQRGDDVEIGVLRSEAGIFPILAGIPILSHEHLSPHLRDLFHGGRYDEAVAWATAHWAQPVGWFRLLRWMQRNDTRRRLWRWVERGVPVPSLTRPPDPLSYRGANRPSVSRLFEIAQNECHLAPPGTVNFSSYRFGAPSHLVALSFIHAMGHPRGLVLDLGCGAGQITWAIRQQAAPAKVVGVDRSFFALRIARTRIVPEAWLVCADAATLPFRSESFDVALSSDAFFHFRGKWPAVREIERVLGPAGTFMLTGLRNKLRERRRIGSPLTASGYRRLASHLPHRLLPDSLIVERYLAGSGVPGAAQPDDDSLDRAFSVSLWARKGPEEFQDIGPFEGWPHAHGILRVNPLYERARSSSSGTAYVRRFDLGAIMNPDAPAYLPDVFALLPAQEQALEENRSAGLEELLRRCAVLGVPERYF